MDTSMFNIVSVRHYPEFQKKMLERLDTEDCQEFRPFVHSVHKLLREYRKPKFKFGDRVRI